MRAPTRSRSIIRDVWPDELEDRALEIARRESKYRPTAKNNCCYGVFQIYWSVHRGWLADLGITSAEQLFDPTLNARAALTLYQRAGGWGPWGAETARSGRRQHGDVTPTLSPVTNRRS